MIADSNRLSALTDLVIKASRYGAGMFQFTARYPYENFEIRKLAETDGNNEVVQLLNKALDEMSRADEVAEDPHRRYMRHRYTQPLYKTIDRLQAVTAQDSVAVPDSVAVSPGISVPTRHGRMITSYDVLPRN